MIEFLVITAAACAGIALLCLGATITTWAELRNMQVKYACLTAAHRMLVQQYETDRVFLYSHTHPAQATWIEEGEEWKLGKKPEDEDT